MSAPLVSVIMATYNHEPFVAESIGSVLAQEGVRIELIVADDGSRDGTRDVVAGIRDPRLRFFPNTVNRGACVVTNELVERATGEYVALINSDDAWQPGKLAHQLAILERDPQLGASFTNATFVDREGAPIPTGDLGFGDVFMQENRSAGRWLRRFFDVGNCLCHPSILIRRRCYDELGLYNNRLRQLPDFDMWIRLVKRYALHVSAESFVRFRILPGENASSQTPTNSTRTLNEHYLIARTFFEGVGRDAMIDGFGDCLVLPEIPSERHLEIEKCLMYFRDIPWLERPYRLHGLTEMSRLLESPVHAAILARDYDIDDRWFHAETGKTDILRPLAPVHAAAARTPPLPPFARFRKSAKRLYKRVTGKT